jgi:hypothetical protein
MRRMFPADRPAARRGQLELRCIPGQILAETMGIPVLNCGCRGRISTVAPPLPEPGHIRKTSARWRNHLHCASMNSFDCIQPLSRIPAASDGLFLTLVRSAYCHLPRFLCSRFPHSYPTWLRSLCNFWKAVTHEFQPLMAIPRLPDAVCRIHTHHVA